MPLIESKAFKKEGYFSRCVTHEEEEKSKRKYSIDMSCHLGLLFHSHLCVRLIVFYVTLVNTSTLCQDH